MKISTWMSAIYFMLGLNCAAAQDADSGTTQKDVMGHSHQSSSANKPLKGQSIYNLGSIWTDQSGVSTGIESLRGQPVIVAMTYTSCKDICPLIVADMMAIEDQLKAMNMDHVRFVLFSIDPDLDRPAKLKTYADERGLDLRKWSLLTGDTKSVRALAAILGVRYRRLSDGQFDHLNLLTLLDSDGIVAYQAVGDRQGTSDFVSEIHKIMPQ